MNYHTIEPEVIVGLGESTIMDTSTHPPTISQLHIDLEDWLGDDLMETFPCFIITERLAKQLKTTRFSGYEIDNVLVSEAQYFRSNYTLEGSIPKFFWLKITGRTNSDDLFIKKDLKLSISLEVLNFLRKNFSIKYADIDKKNSFDDLFAGL